MMRSLIFLAMTTWVNGVTGLRPTFSRQECLDAAGVIVGDIGEGAIHRDDYLCELTQQPPIADIVPIQGEQVAIEGEVCCASRPLLSLCYPIRNAAI